MITKTCEICGKAFLVKPYRAKLARFCSFECGGKWHAQTRLAHTPKPWAAANLDGHRQKSPTRFTTERVKGKGTLNWIEGTEFTCEHCSKVFQVKPWIIRQNGTPRFCSRECFRTSGCFVGDKSPAWVGGPSTYRGRSWLKARLLAVERDKGTCQGCGKVVGSSIPVHHVHPFREFETAEAANQLDNLICLCQSCHMRQEHG